MSFSKKWLGMGLVAACLSVVGCGSKEQAGAVLDAAKYGIGKAAKICPVSEEKIGEHGQPAELTLSNGKKIMVCCAQCEKPIEKDLKKYEALMY